MNKLIERLEHTLGYDMDDNAAIQDAIRALKAADRMAEVIARMHNGAGVWGSSHEALTAYRNLTQETPHAG